MNKGLEALYNPKQALNNIRFNYFESKRNEDANVEHFWFDTIEKELKALEIIKNRCVNTYDEIFCCDSYKEYQDLYHYAEEKFNLEKEEWEFLKEVLKDED